MKYFVQNGELIIETAAKVLKSGGCILYPTDTIWGVGCDATNIAAVHRLFEVKKRSSDRPLIILVADEFALRDLVEVPPKIWEMLSLSKKPISVIYDVPKNVPHHLLAKDGSIAVRLVKNKLCENLISRVGVPLVSTSANFSGERSPVKFSDIRPEILQGVDYVVRGEEEESSRHEASSIVRLSKDGEIEIIRK